MLRILSFGTLLAGALVTFMVDASLAIPVTVNYGNSAEFTEYYNYGSNMPRLNPLNRSAQPWIVPVPQIISTPGLTGLWSSYPTGIVSYPSANPIVIINNINIINRIPLQPTCTTTIIGSPIPSPVPINPRTGAFCR